MVSASVTKKYKRKVHKIWNTTKEEKERKLETVMTIYQERQGLDKGDGKGRKMSSIQSLL